ncbi:1-deoxy-D-xylulose-5-phosphate synthase [Saccharopolyspora phatthalungensis]|uniref:1-deoxy-D-xylulose-5-phosphate synthase n=1 Tax=Saccharopolyspora phatthalungensis TaxID=664693 RepID=A0A840Q9A8_9PSEU|nr:1-deoxy-D-xylulose-5-phosphate synthase [Saccharopolyspora phatthalungensis]MBB5156517.1 1-deoxy-D-xylulose-5-phosphate synthase [Saccharopolyspora phatthalungensis]
MTVTIGDFIASVPVPRQRTALLETVAGPADLRRLDHADLAELSAEIREFLVTSVSAVGGHLGPNLGIVELTLALHRVFHSPQDRILFDIGHQAYVHKLVTGRAAGFASLRQYGGLSGYPSRAESEHDVIENSHASTVLAYADGMAKAFAISGESDRHVVAVIGDGALTGGMCWEALNNIGDTRNPIVVVLNDNERSYSATVGSIAAHLRELRNNPRAKPLFEDLGLTYLGPVDGHDTEALEAALSAARATSRPTIVHCVTVKGKGYPPAEQDEADRMHACGQITPATGKPISAGKPSWTSVFEREIAAIGERRQDVVAISAAMPLAVGLGTFAERFPDRFFDVGMAEQHAVTSAAGLAMGGTHPVVAIYATFLNRAFDQVLLDVALHRLPVTFVLDRAGITGPDGPSHHGMWDLSMLAMVPGLRVACPRDAARLRRLLEEAVDTEDGPTAIRFPKASIGEDIPAVGRVGDVEVLLPGGNDVLLVAVGATAPTCLAVAEALTWRGIGVTVVDPGWVLPVDSGLLDLARDHRTVYVVEDGLHGGGVGDAVARTCGATGVSAPVRSFGIPGRFLHHGTPQQLARDCGLDAEGITDSILRDGGL